jgi:SAM-dependent methyltransferase
VSDSFVQLFCCRWRASAPPYRKRLEDLMSDYRANVAEELASAIGGLGDLERFLDFGAGDGWMLDQVLAGTTNIGAAKAVDVQERKEAYHHHVDFYDGDTLPYPDRHFDGAMAVDVLHHAPEPERSLQDLARVVDGYLIIKDHTQGGPVGFATLAVLDEIGNRKWGIPSRYRYQRGWAWDEVLSDAGFDRVMRRHPLQVHGDIRSVTNRLQYLAVFQRRR